jgi:glycosyltransferase involved in cell wall biosynthesis
VAPQRVAYIHNRYRQAGGEDQTVASETAMLRAHGHFVLECIKHNEMVPDQGLISRIGVGINAIWNRRAYREIKNELATQRIDIAHFHNTMPLYSPLVYYAARDLGIPVVQTLHNWRFFCPKATLFRDGHICEDCLKKSLPIDAVIHRCYRDSRLGSLTQALNIFVHNSIGTFSDVIDAYICMTEFARSKAIEGGLPAERIFVKPHFIHPDPGIGIGDGNFILFVARLSAEKGISTLLRAWQLARPGLLLRIVGDGPERGLVEAACREDSTIEWLGEQPYAAVLELMGVARCVVFPSESYETFGRVVIEAFARGTPVVASDIGGNPELVIHDKNGLLFKTGDAKSLAAQLRNLAEGVPLRMREGARGSYLQYYSEAENYRRQIEIYQNATVRARPSPLVKIFSEQS